MTLEEAMIIAARAELERQGKPDRPLTFEEARAIVAGAIRGVNGIIVESLTPQSLFPPASEVGMRPTAPRTNAFIEGLNDDFDVEFAQLTKFACELEKEVAEWKSRAEKAEAALKAMEEDDRHLCKP